MFLFLLAGTIHGDEPTLALDASRAEVIAKLGKPKSSVKVGSKEVLLFDGGKVVLLNGQMKSFEPAEAKPSAGGLENDPAGSKPTGGTYNEIKMGQAGWLTELDEAKAQAAQEGKRILFLVTADMQMCPAGVRFNRLIASGANFPRMMSSDYVLLLLDLSSLGNSPDHPIEIGSPEYAKFLKVKEVLDLRESVFKSITIPAMAILSVDAKSSTIVNIEEATTIAGYDHMLSVTQGVIKAAENEPMKRAGMSLSSIKPPHVILVFVVGLGLFWMIKRLF